MSVGMLITPKRAASAGSASTSTLQTLAFPPRAMSTSSSMGACMRQGPHQVAQKSTTHLPLPVTSSKSLALRCCIAMSVFLSEFVLYIF